MSDRLIDRRTLLVGSAGLLAAPFPSPAFAQQPRSNAKTLTTSPSRVFWADDAKSPSSTATCCFVSVLPNKAAGKATRGELVLRSKGATVKEEKWNENLLGGLEFEVPGENRYYGIRVTAPKALAVDSVSVDFWQGKSHWAIEVKPEWYETKSKLIFPFRGPGLISQGWVNDNGHANASSQFAIDVLGLTETYAPVLNNDETNESYAGFGRQIIAPAAGIVVDVQNAIPNQLKPDSMDPKLFTLPDGRQVSQGNFVIIDHENGEFSYLMHMQPGSVLVTKDQRVTQGQPVGKLGNAGNTFGPHIHFQLQDGISFARANGLPCKFENVHGALTRGRYFSAK